LARWYSRGVYWIQFEGAQQASPWKRKSSSLSLPPKEVNSNI
jgi:hypothetical protein